MVTDCVHKSPIGADISCLESKVLKDLQYDYSIIYNTTRVFEVEMVNIHIHKQRERERERDFPRFKYSITNK